MSVSYAIQERRGSFGDRRAELPNLAVDKIAIQKDILEGNLGSNDIADGDREEIQHELDLVRNQWVRRINGSFRGSRFSFPTTGAWEN